MFASEAQRRTWGSHGHLRPKYKPFSGKEGGLSPSVSHPFTVIGICWPQAPFQGSVTLTLGNEAAAPSTAATGHGWPAVLGGAVSSLDMDPSWEIFSGQSVSSQCLWPLKHNTANAQPGGPELRKGQQLEITVAFPGG